MKLEALVQAKYPHVTVRYSRLGNLQYAIFAGARTMDCSCEMTNEYYDLMTLARRAGCQPCFQ